MRQPRSRGRRVAFVAAWALASLFAVTGPVRADDDEKKEPAAADEEPPDVGAAAEQVQEQLELGLEAEWAQDFDAARAAYEKAAELDPKDPVPLRFLGELHRVHTGDWEKATGYFEKALSLAEKAEPRDRLTEAIACHGLGKLAVSDEEFEAGMEYYKRSIEAHPTALCYRNMAIHMSYMKQLPLAQTYAKKAIELHPEDPFNRVFYAVFQALDGKTDRALEVLEAIELTPAMLYNAAAVHAVAGNKQKALELFGRYLQEFHKIEQARNRTRYEALGDAAFASLHADEDFRKLCAEKEGG